MYTSPQTQKEILNEAAKLLGRLLSDEVTRRVFAIIADESRDSAIKEHMAQFVHFLTTRDAFVNPSSISPRLNRLAQLTSYTAISNLLNRHQLNLSKIPGQGYYDASNMSGEYNVLQKLIIDVNPHAIYFDCPVHRLEPVLVASASSVLRWQCSSRHW